MFKLKLANKDDISKQVDIDFPAGERELAEKLNKIGIGISTEKNCIAEEIYGDDGSALLNLTGKSVNADEVQFLSKLLESFNYDELQTFYAGAFAEKLETVKDLINLCFNLDCYTLVTDFSDLSAIGKSHELNRRGGIPLNEMPEIDFSKIGQDVIRNEKGTITPIGVLYRTGNEWFNVYNGSQFPEYCCNSAYSAIISLHYDSGSDGEKKEYVFMPCEEVEIEKALNRLGAESADACYIELNFQDLSTEMLMILDSNDYPLSENLDTVNIISECFIGFGKKDIEKLNTAVEILAPASPKEILAICDNLRNLKMIPEVYSNAEYGFHLAMEYAAFRKDESMADFFDFTAYGENTAIREKGRYTDFGYIAYLGNKPEMTELFDRLIQLNQIEQNGQAMHGIK